LVIESINPSVFQQRVSVDPAFRSLRNQLNLETDFIDDMSAAFAKGQYPAADDPFDLALEVGGSGLGVLDNTLTGQSDTGLPVNISGDSVTFTTENGVEKLRATPFHDVSVRRSSENTLTVFNETTNEAFRLEKGEALEVTGDGQIELTTGDNRSLRLEPGEAATLVEKNDSLQLDEEIYRNTITLTNESKTLRILGESGDRITLFTGPNDSLEFNTGTDGSIERLDDGSLRITNRSTGESLTVDSLETLKAQGDAEVAIGQEPAFEIEDGDKVIFSSTEEGLELKNDSVTDTTLFDRSNAENENSLSLGTAESLGAQARVMGNLLTTPNSSFNPKLQQPSSGNAFGSVDQIIEPLGERERSELTELGLSLDEEEQSVFFEESQVAEPFEELPSLIDFEQGESETGFFGENDGGFLFDEDDNFSLFDDESDSVLLDDE
jgi:hypothetical protein